MMLRQNTIRHIAWLNNHLKLFYWSVLNPSSRKELIYKATYRFKRIKNSDQYEVALKKGRVYISYYIQDCTLVITGFHLNNDYYDENNNPIFITGLQSKDIGKINQLINLGIRI